MTNQGRQLLAVVYKIRHKQEAAGKFKQEASQHILHLSHYPALIPVAVWMLISVSQHSAASLCNFDSLMFFIAKTSQRLTKNRETQHPAWFKCARTMRKRKCMQHLHALQRANRNVLAAFMLRLFKLE